MHHPDLGRNPKVRLAMSYAIDRKADRGQPCGMAAPSIPAGLQWPFYDQMFVQGWTVPEYTTRRWRASLLKQDEL